VLTLIHVTGRSQRTLAVDTPFVETKNLFDLNFFSVVHLTKLVLPIFLSNGGGQFAVVSSTSGFLGTPMGTSYSATKFALVSPINQILLVIFILIFIFQHGYFEGLRSELANNNINVLMICPGPVESEIAQHAVRNPADIAQPEGKKMPTARCASLIVRAMFHKYSEVWIAEQPILLMSYLARYAPGITRQVSRKICY
jgi:dehydrogenase/reductase SDR family protein 7